MPTLFLIRGPIDSGKLTLAIALVGEANVIRYEDQPILDQQDLDIFESNCQCQCEALMRRNVMIAVANPNLTLSRIEPYLELARRYKYTVHVVHCEALLDVDGVPTSHKNDPAKLRLALLTMQESRFEPFLVSRL